MGIITKTKTWADQDNVTYTDINANFDTLYTEVNGNLDNENVDASAAIAESKVAFNVSTGHSHDGVDSKLIQVNRAFTWYVAGGLTTGTNNGIRYIAPEDLTIVKVWLRVRTAPTGAGIIIDINKNGTTIWSTQGNRGTIAASGTDSSATSFDVTALTAGDYLDLDIDQVGSTVAGSDLTVVLETTQP